MHMNMSQIWINIPHPKFFPPSTVKARAVVEIEFQVKPKVEVPEV